jgi:hypothetical protein
MFQSTSCRALPQAHLPAPTLPPLRSTTSGVHLPHEAPDIATIAKSSSATAVQQNASRLPAYLEHRKRQHSGFRRRLATHPGLRAGGTASRKWASISGRRYGEVVPVDETGRPQFYDLLRRAGACLCGLRLALGRWCRPAIFASQKAAAAAASRVARGLGDRFRGAFRYRSRLRALRADVRE